MAQAPKRGDFLSYNDLPDDLKKELLPFLGAQELANVRLISKIFHQIINDPATWNRVALSLHLKVNEPMKAKAVVFAEYERRFKAILASLEKTELRMEDSENIDPENRKLLKIATSFHQSGDVFQRYALLKQYVSTLAKDPHFLFRIDREKENVGDEFIKVITPEALAFLLEAGVRFSSESIELLLFRRNEAKTKKIELLLEHGVKAPLGAYNQAVTDFKSGNASLWLLLIKADPHRAEAFLLRNKKLITAEQLAALASFIPEENK